MSSTSEISFKALAIPYFGEVLGLIDEVLQQHGVPYYLIGANAISLQLLRQGEAPLRGTKDIDFAIMVSSFAQYDAVKGDLVARGFQPVRLPFTLRHVEHDVVIDLLPFGEIEENDTVNFTERRVDLVVLGFRETLSDTDTIRLDSAYTVQVPPLAGIVILKLIAWSDRPEMRGTDLDDIYRIVSVYHDLLFDEIVERYSDLLLREPYDQRLIAARVLGYKIAPIAGKSAKLEQRIVRILDDNIRVSKKSGIAERWAADHGLTTDYARQLLSELRTGIMTSQ